MSEYQVNPPTADKSSPTATVPNPMNIGFGLVLAFALGLALGFFGRPQIIKDVPIQVVVTVIPDNQAVAQAPSPTPEAVTSSAAASGSNSTNSSPVTTDANEPAADNITNPDTSEEANPAEGEPTPTIMDFVMADARHWQGDEVAPVTIVEFSDFK